MSSSTKGAATAAPAVLNGDEVARADQWEADALRTINKVQDVTEAERLLGEVRTITEAMRWNKHAGDRKRRWQALELLAERRYGELLGPPKRGGSQRANVSSGKLPLDEVEKTIRKRARRVWLVPPDVFDDYIANEPKPTRTGLLNKAKTTRPTKKTTAGKRIPKAEPAIVDDTKVAHDPDVITWVEQRTHRGWNADQIITTSKAGEDDWPERWPDGLSSGTLAACRAVIYHLERHDPPRRPRYAGKRLREVSDIRKELNRPSVADLSYRILQMTNTLETSGIDDYALGGADRPYVEALFDDLIELQRWMDRTTAFTGAYIDDGRMREKIRKLREDHAGRTPAEIRTAQERADKLEEKLERKRELDRSV